MVQAEMVEATEFPELSMRHNVSGRKLNRTSAHRKMLYRNLVTALFKHERIQTTVPKAKEARIVAEKLITFAKKGDLHSRRMAARKVNEPEVLQKISRGNHLAFYVVLIAMPIAGILAVLTGWGAIATIHAWTSKLLLLLIAAHLAGAIWHMFKEDGVVSRMFSRN